MIDAVTSVPRTDADSAVLVDRECVVRFGLYAETARFVAPEALALERGGTVVVRSPRGEQLGDLLQWTAIEARPLADDEVCVLRSATAADLARAAELTTQAAAEFPEWQQRVAEWTLDLDVVDLEWTLDGGKRVVYVLNGRGAATTKLALQAAAVGLGVIEVQPVSATGLVAPAEGGGGCGSGGGCGCSH